VSRKCDREKHIDISSIKISTTTDLGDCDRVDRSSELNISLQLVVQIAKNPALLVVHNEKREISKFTRPMALDKYRLKVLRLNY
jgi:hypothetical protein